MKIRAICKCSDTRSKAAKIRREVEAEVEHHLDLLLVLLPVALKHPVKRTPSCQMPIQLLLTLWHYGLN